MPQIPKDLIDCFVDQKFEMIRSAKKSEENDHVKILQRRLLPLMFKPPAPNDEKRWIAPPSIGWCPTFLHYEMGKTTVTNYGGNGILSGPFSGCWFIKFKWNDKTYAAHVGTGDPETPETHNPKTAFLDWTYENNIRDFVCFNPWDAYSEKEKEEFAARSSYLLAHISGNTCHCIFLNLSDREKIDLRKSGRWNINAPLSETRSQTFGTGYKVVDVRECPAKQWENGVRLNFILSMHKTCGNNRAILPEERRTQIQNFHYAK